VRCRVGRDNKLTVAQRDAGDTERAVKVLAAFCVFVTSDRRLWAPQAVAVRLKQQHARLQLTAPSHAANGADFFPVSE
jgi:hypothetical protein